MTVEKNMKNIKKEFAAKGIFYTQPELAIKLKSYLPDDVKEVYDPTCGAGNLLSEFDDDVEKYGQELDPTQLEIAAERLKNFHGYAGDTLTDDGFKDKKFKYIVANYPFSIKWEQNGSDDRFKNLPKLPPKSKADFAFLAHILHHLSDDGIAVTLNFPGICYRSHSEQAIRQYFIEQNWIDTIEHIEGGTFVDTNIATVVIVFKKNRTTTDIKFKNGDIEKIVSFDEIKQNNYNLSPTSYAFKEQEKEIIDPIQLEKDIRNDSVEKLKKEMTRTVYVWAMFGGSDPSPFISDILEIATKHLKAINDIKQIKNTPMYFIDCLDAVMKITNNLQGIETQPRSKESQEWWDTMKKKVDEPICHA